MMVAIEDRIGFLRREELCHAVALTLLICVSMHQWCGALGVANEERDQEELNNIPKECNPLCPKTPQ